MESQEGPLHQLYELLAETEESRGHFAFLAQATAGLSSSLDVDTVLRRAGQAVVPSQADGCWIDLVDDENAILRRRHVSYGAPLESQAAQVVSTFKAPLGDFNPWSACARTAERVRITDWPEVLADLDPAVRDGFSSLGVRSALILPLRLRQRVKGCITFISQRREFTAGDGRLLEDFSLRLALALENAQLYRQTREALRIRDEFISIASHELKNPLSALKLQLFYLDEAVEKGKLWDLPRHRVGRVISMAKRQSEQMHRLLDNLLDSSRMRAGRLSIERREFDLTYLVREVAARFEPEMLEAGQCLTLEIEGSIIGVWDRTRIEQVLTNLLSNARKYGAGRPVTVTLTGDESEVRLSVSDQGLGIAYEDQKRIFDRFERTADVRSINGLGLGLYIVHQIVEGHGGTIKLESRPGEGSCFTVVLPRGVS